MQQILFCCLRCIILISFCCNSLCCLSLILFRCTRLCCIILIVFYINPGNTEAVSYAHHHPDCTSTPWFEDLTVLCLSSSRKETTSQETTCRPQYNWSRMAGHLRCRFDLKDLLTSVNLESELTASKSRDIHHLARRFCKVRLICPTVSEKMNGNRR